MPRDSGTDDPYGRSNIPPAPTTPPRFSLLRPFRMLGCQIGRLAWWYLTAEVQGEPYEATGSTGVYTTRDPTLFGFFGLVCCVFCVICAFAAPFDGSGAVSAPVYFCGAFVLVRAWLRAAMHLDEPESRAWWEERLK